MVCLTAALAAWAQGAPGPHKGFYVYQGPDRDKKILEQAREIAKLTARAERAEAIAEIQKKVAALLGRPFPSEES